MSGTNVSHRRWSWSSCFAIVKHNQKSKSRHKDQSDQKKLTANGHKPKKRSRKVDENSNILYDFDRSQEPSAENEYDSFLITSISAGNNLFSTNNDEQCLINDGQNQSSGNHFQRATSNQKPSSSVRAAPLDAIVEELNEESVDDSNESNRSVRLCCDRDIIKDCVDLHSGLLELSEMKHIVVQFNDNGHLYGDFTRQISKLKLKINDLERTSVVVPRDPELLEARYSTLVGTIENLSLLLKITQISSSRMLINRLLISIEQRMEQLNKLVQLASLSPMDVLQQRQELNDDDFLSFRSAFSSYEHLLTMS